MPTGGTAFVSVKEGDKPVIVPAVRNLLDAGFNVIATTGTQAYLSEQGLAVERVNKVAEGQPHIVDRMIDGDIALVFNTTEGWQSMLDSANPSAPPRWKRKFRTTPRRLPRSPQRKRLRQSMQASLKCGRCRTIIAETTLIFPDNPDSPMPP